MSSGVTAGTRWGSEYSRSSRHISCVVAASSLGSSSRLPQCACITCGAQIKISFRTLLCGKQTGHTPIAQRFIQQLAATCTSSHCLVT